VPEGSVTNVTETGHEASRPVTEPAENLGENIDRVILLATVADRIGMAEKMIGTARRFLPGWRFVVVTQEYGDADKARLYEALGDTPAAVEHLPKRIGPHCAKLAGLDIVLQDAYRPGGPAIAVCSADDDMEFIAGTNLEPCVARAQQPGVGLVSAAWVWHESLLRTRKVVDEFVRQKLVYTGGGMVFSGETAKLIRAMPRLPYFSDNVMWSLTSYLAGLENLRYRGSMTIHRVCRTGGRKAWVLLGDKELPPAEFLAIEASKDREKYKIPQDRGVTKAADEAHRRARAAL
jgi:hypothetical protein